LPDNCRGRLFFSVQVRVVSDKAGHQMEDPVRWKN
jgi:hypothetical protein